MSTSLPGVRTSDLLDTVRVTRLRVTLVATESGALPAFPGSMIRGLLGWGLKDVLCSRESAARCEQCHLADACRYPALFEPALHPAGLVPGVADPSPPFVIAFPESFPRAVEACDTLTFTVTLFGRSAQYASDYIAAFFAAATRGYRLGDRGGPFGVGRVSVAFPDNRWQEVSPSDRLTLDDISLPLSQLAGPETTSHPGRLTVEFVTPIRLKTDNHVTGSPRFGVLVDRLADRVARILGTWHGIEWLEHRREFCRDAHAVRAISSTARRMHVTRHSNRQRTSMDLPGVQGAVTYEGPVSAYLPILRLGEFLHVGKNTSAGFGRIRVSA
ncbi:MAG: CRISPR system precrRNA processing endoribonuclease RAMP protein Cas6 [Acidobacteria bacterium]|nr:CRISPR system precrRNA processing endoribonuclease RAMP protein Cas6 [Acidobacteriota bacterium]